MYAAKSTPPLSTNEEWCCERVKESFERVELMEFVGRPVGLGGELAEVEVGDA